MNKRNTKVVAHLAIEDLTVLTRPQKDRLAAALASRLNSDGEIVVHVEEERTAGANRRLALERLTQLISRALVVRRSRVRTRPTRAGQERRLRLKRQRSETKRQRRRNGSEW